MRLVIDTLICLMLVAILGAAVWHYNHQQAEIRLQQSVHAARARIQNQVIYRGALEEVQSNASGFPMSINPGWFVEGLPVNPLVPRSQPWLDVAPAHDMNDHPPDPIIRSETQAGFWYNPSRGLVRVRVLPLTTEQATVDMYNQLNGSNLMSLRAASPAEMLARQPQVVRQPITAVDDKADDRQTLASPRQPTLGNIIRNTNSTTPSPSAAPEQAAALAPNHTLADNEPAARRTLVDAPVSQ